MAVAWSSSDKDVIERKISQKRVNIESDVIEDQSFDLFKIRNAFEVERCAAWIRRKGFCNVTLQFPDNLLQYAPIVAKQIEEDIGGQRVSILGDTSYGECCVDGVAAEHVGADSVIHFGDTCFSPTEKLPVLYIFTQSLCLEMNNLKHEIDEKIVRNKTEAVLNVAIFYDVHYHKIFTSVSLRGDTNETLTGKLGIEESSNFFICHPPSINDDKEQEVNPQNMNNENDIHQSFSVQCGRLVPNSLLNSLQYNHGENTEQEKQPTWTIVYVGDSDIYSEYLALTFPQAEHYLYEPVKKTLVASNSNVKKALMRRYFAIEKTKDAERIGILVGTLGVAKYRDIIDKCRDIIKCSGKRNYTFLVGKPNAPKLANFPEIDVFVVVACPLNSVELSIGNISQGRERTGSDFLRPIITPFELDVALNPKRNWTGGNFQASYQNILPGGQDYIEFDNSKIDETDISLITGKLRISNTSNLDHKKDDGISDDTRSIATQERQLITLTHAGGGGQYLTDRSWKGLEQNLGNAPPVLAVEGRAGIAGHYVGEGETTNLPADPV